jgi:FAD/FMN-containing dehydrogenase
MVAAVDFARQHNLRLVIKGTGHDYLGRSSGQDSLLVWTHRMRGINVHDSFVPSGCAEPRPGTPAVTIGAGTRWLEVYQEVTGRHGRYVQGGGCTSVGAAGGFTQGGGFGSWSKKYGTAAANMLEAEVVTADGQVRIANACQNQDLFWALRGGGGGTFGIVSRVTLRTHPLPSYFGLTVGRITATSDASFTELLERFFAFYTKQLDNEHWGEQVKVNGDNSLDISMGFQGMSASEAAKRWLPMRTWVDEHRDRFAMQVRHIEVPGTQMWNREYILQHLPQAIVTDSNPNRSGSLYWWADNQNEVSAYWYAYQSQWVPLDTLKTEGGRALATALFEASRRWPVELHFNKGLAGASRDALERSKETSMNPAVYRAAALAIVSASGDGYPGIPGHEPDLARAEADRARVMAAMKILRETTPGAGTYVNESDYFEPDWQQTFWGDHYSKLLAIKTKYDPEGLLFCHHCVGSEVWSDDGRCRMRAGGSRQ